MPHAGHRYIEWTRPRRASRISRGGRETGTMFQPIATTASPKKPAASAAPRGQEPPAAIPIHTQASCCASSPRFSCALRASVKKIAGSRTCHPPRDHRQQDQECLAAPKGGATARKPSIVTTGRCRCDLLATIPAGRANNGQGTRSATSRGERGDPLARIGKTTGRLKPLKRCHAFRPPRLRAGRVTLPRRRRRSTPCGAPFSHLPLPRPRSGC